MHTYIYRQTLQLLIIFLAVAGMLCPAAPAAAAGAPAQSWQLASGPASLHGSLSKGRAAGSLGFANGRENWLMQGGLKAGLLNQELSFGLDLAGGWLLGPDFGFWLRLAGELTPENLDHYQAVLNLGYRLSRRTKLLGTLDFLAKRLEIERWQKAQTHDQYGAGLALDHQLRPGLGLALFYQIYQTDGRQYGRVGDYEYVDQDNWQHYGWIYGGVRGGRYQEGGLDFKYKHPGGRLELGLSLSLIQREYEEMLDHPARDESNAGSRLRLGWRDLFGSGLDLSAGLSGEFSARDRLGWHLGLVRRLGIFSLGLAYSEQHNDQSRTDRRIYLSLGLPLNGLAARAKGKRPPRKSRAADFAGDWLKQSVSGMGSPVLKVAQEVEKRLDQTIVDLDQLASGVSLRKNLMTISGLPALQSLESALTTPASAAAAFSIGPDGASVIVDISKLPKPAYIQAVFLQKNGLYSAVTLQTEKGSTKVTNQGHIGDVDQAFINYLKQLGSHLKHDRSKVKADLYGTDSAAVGHVYTYGLAMGSTITAKTYWEVTGNGQLLSGNTLQDIDVKALAPGQYVVTVYIVQTWGEHKGYYDKASRTVTVVDTSHLDDDPQDGSGDGGSGGCEMLSKGSWVFNAGAFSLTLAVDALGNVTLVANNSGVADPNSITVGENCSGGVLHLSVDCTIAGAAYTYDLALNYSNGTVAAGSTVTETKDGSTTGTYTVTANHFP